MSGKDGGHLVAVMTASSNSGAACVEELLTTHKAVGVRVRACFRSEEKAAPLRQRFAGEVASGVLEVFCALDAGDESTVASACSGATMALVVTPCDHAAGMDNDGKMSMNMLQGAVKAGCRHVVYVGSWTVPFVDKLTVLGNRFIDGDHFVTEGLKGGPATGTCLRAGYFLTNFLLTMGALKAGNVISSPSITLPPVHPADNGRVAAKVFVDKAAASEEHDFRTYNISGERKYTMPQLAAAFGKVLGREIEYQPVAAADVIAQRSPPQFIAELLSTLEAEDCVPLSDDVKRLTGSVTTLEDWLEQNKAAFALQA